MHILTEQEEIFTFGIFEGMSQYDAYTKAFKRSRKWKKDTVYSKASTLAKQDKIKERLQELKETANSKRILSFQQIQELLSDRARDGLNTDGLRAIDILNKMAGNYEKDNKLKVDSTEDKNLKITFE